MTIRKRLFISNILMIVIPLILSVVLLSTTHLILTGVLNIGHFNDGGMPVYSGMQYAEELAQAYQRSGDFDKLKEQVATFNYNRSDALQMQITMNGEMVYPTGEGADPQALELLEGLENGSLVIAGKTAAYVTGAGEYGIVVSDAAFDNAAITQRFGNVYRAYIGGVGGVMILLFLLLIFFTNLILTRLMYKNIIGPLNRLVEGVHEIRDENLAYRIQYSKKDEFASVADDFNEMAGYLQDMVAASQRDSENRKELVAGISHDLRTPLTSIKAYLEGLESGVASTPKMQRKYFNTIKRKTEDIEHIVSQLFLFSKLDVGEFPLSLETVDVGRLLTSYIDGVRDEYLQKGLHITLMPQNRVYCVTADEVQLRNVLTNVLENSVKYSDRSDTHMEVRVSEENGDAVITLTDNGNGVPPAVLDKLFNVFYREDLSRNNPSKGSGLGLAISAKIIEGFGGTIEAENVTGAGLSIVISLPIIREDKP